MTDIDSIKEGVDKILEEPMQSVEGGGPVPPESYMGNLLKEPSEADVHQKAQENMKRIQEQLTGRGSSTGAAAGGGSEAQAETADRPLGGTKRDTREWQRVKQAEANERYGKGY